MFVYQFSPSVQVFSLALIVVAIAGLSLLAGPGSKAQGTIPTATLGPVYLPLVSKFIPTATPTPTVTPTATNTLVPPTATSTPISTPVPTSARLFNVVVVSHCLPQEAGNWFEGITYVGGQPQSGYKVVFSYAPDGPPVTAPAQSGPHNGYPGWKPGYYSHIIHAHGPEAGDWYVWIVDDAGQRISDIGHWASMGPGGDCNQAVVDFDAR